jgi:hypothetical protein
MQDVTLIKIVKLTWIRKRSNGYNQLFLFKNRKNYTFHCIKVVLWHGRNTAILTKSVIPDTHPSLVLTVRRLKFIENFSSYVTRTQHNLCQLY